MTRAVITLLLVLAPASAAQAATDFERVVLASGLDQPTAVAFAPDGRMFVAEKEGRVRVVTADGRLDPLPALDISDRVAAYGDRGLLGIAVDAEYPAHPYLYLLYNREHEPEVPDGPKEAVLTRVELGATIDPGSETVIVGGGGVDGVCPPGADCIPAGTPVHSIGTVRSAPDGTLYVGNGDGGAAWQIGSAESRKTYDPDSYRGKILRVRRDGTPVPGHPYCAGATDDRVCAKVFAMGFRNPFRFGLREGGGVFAGDVGENTWEEINTVTGAGNFGWPCYEGFGRTAGHGDTPGCQAAYADMTFSFPTHAYYNSATSYDHRASVVGGPVYREPGDYPDAYDGAIVYSDTIRGFLRALRVGAGGVQDSALMPENALAYPTDVVPGPPAMNGDLVVVELGAGQVTRIRYAPVDRTPIAVADATPRHGKDVLRIEFSSDGSHDPFGEAVEYEWDFGDGTPTSDAANPEHTYAAAGAYVARLTVTDPGGRSATAQVNVFPGHDPPEVVVEAPASGARFDAGGLVALEGAATDDQDAPLEGNALAWDVQLHHADHVHFLGRFHGGTAAFRTMRSHDADSWYEVALTATDARGLSATAAPIQIRPNTAPVRLLSEPPGAPLAYDTRPGVAPWEFAAARGFDAPISAAGEFVADGRVWRFERWSNGGEQAQVVRVPAEGMTLTAVYRETGAASEDPVGEPPPPVPAPPLPLLDSVARDLNGPEVRLLSAGARGLSGLATDTAGVASVRLALRRRAAGRCRHWSRAAPRLSRPRRCRAPVWHSARLGRTSGSTRRWTLRLRGALPPGRYEVLVRAADSGGNVTTRWRGGRRTTRLRIPRT